MPTIAPFSGIRYNRDRVPDLRRVVSPPYDMISRREQEALYERDPYNVVRLILGRGEEGADRYTMAATYYRKWRGDGILERETAPSIYVYRQEYTWEERRISRQGLIARVALEEFGRGAHPHETTLSGPKEDRLKLLEATRVNFSAIFSLYSDPDGQVEEQIGGALSGEPVTAFVDGQGIGHRLWKIEDAGCQEAIARELKGKDFIIADGHHRYETALKFRRLMHQRKTARDSYDYVMMFLTAIESPGLTIHPFHRFLAPGLAEDVAEKLRPLFRMEEIPCDGAEGSVPPRLLSHLAGRPGAECGFGLYLGGDTMLLLSGDAGGSPHLDNVDPAVAALDVTVLHRVIFRGLLGLDESRLVQDGAINFYSRPEDALSHVRSQPGSAAFFMRPTRKEQVWKVAVTGKRMPQKSTNFFPKLTTGLVFNEL